MPLASLLERVFEFGDFLHYPTFAFGQNRCGSNNTHSYLPAGYSRQRSIFRMWTEPASPRPLSVNLLGWASQHADSTRDSVYRVPPKQVRAPSKTEDAGYSFSVCT